MKIAFIADGRSEHTRRWIPYFLHDHVVILLSTYECQPIEGVDIVTLPGRFRLTNQLISEPDDAGKMAPIINRFFLWALRNPIANQLWGILKLFDLFLQVKVTRATLKDFNPDILHAFRIQTEGYLAAFSGKKNFLVSCWGSDFTYTARTNWLHSILTKITMRRVNYFMADCSRDLKLAEEFGLAKKAYRCILPGNGGVDVGTFYPSPLLSKTPSIFYCRGLGPLTRVDTLFEGLSLLRRDCGISASLTVISPRSTHHLFFELARDFGIDSAGIVVLDFSEIGKFANLMRQNTIFVSPMISDGVPCSMREAMACGMIPVMSDLESIREYVVDSINGFLFDPD
jgi:glycosyltransferase involved in cell wall biosynthesis